MLINQGSYTTPRIDPARLSVVSMVCGEKVLWKVLLDGNLWAAFPTKDKALLFASKENKAFDTSSIDYHFADKDD